MTNRKRPTASAVMMDKVVKGAVEEGPVSEKSEKKKIGRPTKSYPERIPDTPESIMRAQR